MYVTQNHIAVEGFMRRIGPWPGSGRGISGDAPYFMIFYLEPTWLLDKLFGEDIIKKMYSMAVKEQLRQFLMSSEKTLTIDEARARLSKKWPR